MTRSHGYPVTYTALSPAMEKLHERAKELDKQIKYLNFRVLEHGYFVQECLDLKTTEDLHEELLEYLVPPEFLDPFSEVRFGHRIYNIDVDLRTVAVAYVNSERQALITELAIAVKQVADIDAEVKALRSRNPSNANIRRLDNWVEEFLERLPVVQEGVKELEYIEE